MIVIPEKIKEYHTHVTAEKAKKNDFKIKKLSVEIGGKYYGDLVDCLEGDYSVQDAIDYLYEKYFGSEK